MKPNQTTKNPTPSSKLPIRQKYKALKRKVTLYPNYKEYLTLNETRQGFCEYAILSIEEAIKRNDNIARLFIINNSHEFQLDKTEWIETLNNIIKIYQEQEQYEKCVDCLNLIKKL
jgi:hypothetical protein